MFFLDANPEINDKEIIMNQFTENCFHQEQTSQYHGCTAVGPPANYYRPSHQMEWGPSNIMRTGQSEQALTFQSERFQSDSFIHHNSIQYTPLTPEPVPHQVFHLPRPYKNNDLMAKKHRARITFVPTMNGNFKAIVKRKRKRTIFTTNQVEALERIFKFKQYITREEREVIVNQLQLPDKAVKVWFQNRRLKDKKGPESLEEEVDNLVGPGERSSPDIARLNYVESKINEKTDEFGYVTLDDSVMKELFGVIDGYLASNNTQNIEEISDSSSSPIYEPISPASASYSTDEDNSSQWEPSEPNESLQRLFDLQSML